MSNAAISDSEYYRVQRDRLLSAFSDLRRAGIVKRILWAISPWGLCRHETSSIWHVEGGRECPLCGERKAVES